MLKVFVNADGTVTVKAVKKGKCTTLETFPNEESADRALIMLENYSIFMDELREEDGSSKESMNEKIGVMGPIGEPGTIKLNFLVKDPRLNRLITILTKNKFDYKICEGAPSSSGVKKSDTVDIFIIDPHGLIKDLLKYIAGIPREMIDDIIFHE